MLQFNLKIKFPKCHLFSVQHNLPGKSADHVSANSEKEDKVKDKPVPTNPKELQSFLGLASYYCQFIPMFAAITKCLPQLVGPANHQKSKKARAMNLRQTKTKKISYGQVNTKQHLIS